MIKLNCAIELLPNYDPDWGLPCYAKPGDAGFDLRAAFQYDDLKSMRFESLESISFVSYYLPNQNNLRFGVPNPIMIVPCGFKVAIPEGYQLEIRPRSGLAAKHGITVVNSPGTIDSGYRGEIMVILARLGVDDSFRIKRGDKIAQAVLMPVYQANFIQVEKLDETERGTGGLGSTGV